jgi:hypothetical protein
VSQPQVIFNPTWNMNTVLLIVSAVFVAALPQRAMVSASRFDIDRAVSAIRVASFAYCTPQAITSKSCRTCGSKEIQALQSIVAGTNNALNWYMGYEPSKNTIKIAFRGTNSFTNWRANAHTFSLTTIDGMRVHSGWYEDYMRVKPQVQAQITALIRAHPTANILFTGHSTGGVYATLAAFQGTNWGGWLSSLVKRNKIYIITAGSPRMGDQAFANAMNNRGFGSIVRVSNFNDIATQSPPTSFGFAHYNREMNVNNNVIYFCDQEPAGTTTVGSCAVRHSVPGLLLQPGQAISRHMNYLGVSFENVC